MSDETKRDIDFYTLYDYEGRPLETFTVVVPTDEELRDYWLITSAEGEILGMHQTRIGRVKPEEVLCNRHGQEGVSCYQVSREDYLELLERMREAAMLEEYAPPRDERFDERFVRAHVHAGGIRRQVSEGVWEDLPI